MTNEQKVIEFKSKLDRVFKTYFIAELCANAVEVLIGVIALLFVLQKDNQRAMMIVVACIFIAVFATSFITIKAFFGSVSGMNKVVSFRTRFDFVAKHLEDAQNKCDKGEITADDLTIAKTIYDDEINSLVNEIDSITVKK